jgi:plastocyanin
MGDVHPLASLKVHLTVAVVFALGCASAAAVVFSGCGSDPASPADAAHSSTVKTVSCDGLTPDLEVVTVGNSFSPMTMTVPINGVVRWTLPAQHNVASTMMDSGLAVDFGQTMCLKFTQAGTFDYQCTRHGFMGTVTVQ